MVHLRIDAEGDPIFFPVKAVFETPPLSARRGDLEIESIAVIALDGFCGGLGIADQDIGKGHLGATPKRGISCPLMLPPVAPSCPRMSTESDNPQWINDWV